MFRKILIANRGEISLRVLRACRELGIPALSVFSEADRLAPHVLAADEAACIGGPAPKDSYLNIPNLLAAARNAGCDGVHPGYGFLSENPDFAEAVEGAGLTFIGPTPAVMRRLGDKLGARRLMKAAGLPVAPGSLETSEDPDRLAADARAAGWPVFLKAARGGGGRGIRLATDEKELRRLVPTASAEALTAFGSGSLYVERRIAPARHVEVQVLGDRHGNLVHLGERECSIQRRNQKLLEETPSPALDEATREALCGAAVRGAAAAGYVNAGTLEFLLDTDGKFHFLEMNQRIQVEHAITEMRTGLDLVKLQILVAAGKKLPFSQKGIRWRGHAVEVRLCAEDPASGYLPSSGTLGELNLPSGPFVRCDAALRPGQAIGLHYDSLLAKLCAWGEDRGEALGRLSAALAETRILGIRTTLPAFRAVLADPGFLAGRYDTSTLESLAAASIPPGVVQAATVAAALLEQARREGILLPPQASVAEGWAAEARRSGLRKRRP